MATHKVVGDRNDWYGNTGEDHEVCGGHSVDADGGSGDCGVAVVVVENNINVCSDDTGDLLGRWCGHDCGCCDLK